jgi:hypothetical protein
LKNQKPVVDADVQVFEPHLLLTPDLQNPLKAMKSASILMPASHSYHSGQALSDLDRFDVACENIANGDWSQSHARHLGHWPHNGILVAATVLQLGMDNVMFSGGGVGQDNNQQ